MPDIAREGLYHKGFIKLEREIKRTYFDEVGIRAMGWTHVEPFYNTSDEIRIIIDNPGESNIKQLLVSYHIDSLEHTLLEGAFGINMVPHRQGDLRRLFDNIIEADGVFGPDIGGCYPTHSEIELNDWLNRHGHVTLHGVHVIKGSTTHIPRLDADGERNLEALRQSHMIGRDDVNEAVMEAVYQSVQAAGNGLFITEDIAVQRRMMSSIGGKLHRIYERMNSSNLER